MRIDLHFLPERPEHSANVIIFCANKKGELYNIMDTTYSTYWGRFFMRDDSEVMTKLAIDANKGITAWAYLDDAKEAFKDEILG